MRYRKMSIALAILAIAGGAVGGFLLKHDATSGRSSCEGFQCGHWCVYRCAQLLGVPAGMEKIVRRLPPNERGHSMLELSKALRDLGLETEGRRSNWDTLMKMSFPCIAHLKNPDHYIVVCSVEPEKEFVHLFDGSGLRARQSRAKFEQRWTGVLLVVSKPPQSHAAPAFARDNPPGFPQIQFDTLLVDLGDVSVVGKPVEFVFPIRNTGTADLVIDKVAASCTCLMVTKPERPIPPGSTGMVKLRYHLEAQKGPFAHTALVNSNDPQIPHALLTATGFAGVDVQVLPLSLYLNNLVTGRETTARCFVKYSGEWQDLNVHVEGASLKGAELVRHSCVPMDEARCRELALGSYRNLKVPREIKMLEFVTRATGKASDEIKGAIQVRTNVRGYEDFTLNVSGKIQQAVASSPNMLVLSEVEPDASYSQTITLVNRVVDSFQIVGIDAPSPLIRCEYSPSALTDKADVSFQAPGRAWLAAAGKELKIHLRSRSSGEEITVPLIVHVFSKSLASKR
jgi:predicted double-glycine peptidase